jgi:hypothetical protein
MVLQQRKNVEVFLNIDKNNIQDNAGQTLLSNLPS